MFRIGGERRRRHKPLNYALLILGLLVFVTALLLNELYNPLAHRFYEEGPETVAHDSANATLPYAGKVSSVYIERGYTYVTLNDTQKVYFTPMLSGKSSPIFLADFINPGDSLFKEANDKRLIVWKGKKARVFNPYRKRGSAGMGE